MSAVTNEEIIEIVKKLAEDGPDLLVTTRTDADNLKTNAELRESRLERAKKDITHGLHNIVAFRMCGWKEDDLSRWGWCWRSPEIVAAEKVVARVENIDDIIANEAARVVERFEANCEVFKLIELIEEVHENNGLFVLTENRNENECVHDHVLVRVGFGQEGREKCIGYMSLNDMVYGHLSLDKCEESKEWQTVETNWHTKTIHIKKFNREVVLQEAATFLAERKETEIINKI